MGYSIDFPVIAASAGGSNDSGDQTSHTVNLPTGIAEGNLLIVLFATDSTTTAPIISFPGGWTNLFYPELTSSIQFGAWYRIADGTEGATITVTTSEAQTTAHTSYRITGYSGVPEAGTAVAGATTLPNPPSLSPSWGQRYTLWLAVTGYDDGSVSVSAYPSGYSSGLNHRLTNANAAGVGSAKRTGYMASDDPGTFTLSAAEYWYANTIAIAPASGEAKTVTATGVSSGEHVVKVTADGSYLRIYIDGELKNSTALSGASVIANDNDWSFLTNGSAPYMEYHKITVGGVLKQHIVYERAATFQDQTAFDNDATPAFITSTGDPDITVTFENFRPIAESEYTGGVGGEAGGMLTDVPEKPPEMYGEEGEGLGHLPGAEMVETMLGEAGIPTDFFWIWFCYGLAAIGVVLGYLFIRSSLLFPVIIGFAVILFFSIASGGNPVPLWTIIVYGLISAGFIVSERVFGW